MPISVDIQVGKDPVAGQGNQSLDGTQSINMWNTNNSIAIKCQPNASSQKHLRAELGWNLELRADRIKFILKQATTNQLP